MFASTECVQSVWSGAESQEMVPVLREVTANFTVKTTHATESGESRNSQGFNLGVE